MAGLPFSLRTMRKGSGLYLQSGRLQPRLFSIGFAVEKQHRNQHGMCAVNRQEKLGGTLYPSVVSQFVSSRSFGRRLVESAQRAISFLTGGLVSWLRRALCRDVQARNEVMPAREA